MERTPHTVRNGAKRTEIVSMLTNEEEDDDDGVLNNITEENSARHLPTLLELEEIAASLEEAGIDPAAITLLSEVEPKEAAVLLRDLVVEGGRTCEALQDHASALAYADAIDEVINAVTPSVQVHHDLEADDYAITRRVAADGSSRETKKKLRGTMKEVIRGLKTTVPLTKLMHADPKVREYLLYCAVSVIAKLH